MSARDEIQSEVISFVEGMTISKEDGGIGRKTNQNDIAMYVHIW